MPSVRVLLFAAHREAAGRGVAVLDLPEGSTVAELKMALARQLPGLARERLTTVVAVNGKFADDRVPVHPGDEVAVFPPVAGG